MLLYAGVDDFAGLRSRAGDRQNLDQPRITATICPHRRHREDGSIGPKSGYDRLGAPAIQWLGWLMLNHPLLRLSPLCFHHRSYVPAELFSPASFLPPNSYRTSVIPTVHGRNCRDYRLAKSAGVNAPWVKLSTGDCG